MRAGHLGSEFGRAAPPASLSFGVSRQRKTNVIHTHMKSTITASLLLISLCSAITRGVAQIPTFPVISDFSTSNDGWKITYVDGRIGGDAAWSSSGGNPGGYVPYVFAGNAPTGIAAPSKFLGDWSSLDGRGHLQYDHGVFALTGYGGEEPNTVTIAGPGGSATWTGPPGGAPNGGWKTLCTPIDAGSWVVTSGAWSSLLTNITYLNVRLELYPNAGVDEEGIDNVQLDFDALRLSIRCSQADCSQVELCWLSCTNRMYQIQFRSNLATNQWADLLSAIPGDGARKYVTNAVAADQPVRFYRIVQSQ